MASRTLTEAVVEATKSTGVLPCIKLPERADWLAYAQAMHEGGARVIEITMTTPGALEAIEAISGQFKNRLFVAAGTVLDAATARSVVTHGGSLIVSPTVRPDVIAAASEHGVPMYSGAFSATECQLAMESGAAMVKVFPAHVGGPAYMANLKMVFPEIDLIPSGGITLETAGEYIRQGACAVSGARTFMDLQRIEREGLGWLTRRVAAFVEVVKSAKAEKAAKA